MAGCVKRPTPTPRDHVIDSRGWLDRQLSPDTSAVTRPTSWATVVVAVALVASCANDDDGSVGDSKHSQENTLAITQAQISASGRTVTVYASGDPCTHLSLMATESADEVDLKLAQEPSSEICSQTIENASARATLAQPLSRRQLVDSTTGKPIPYFDDSTLATVRRLPAGYELVGSYITRSHLPETAEPTLISLRAYSDPSGHGPRIEVSQCRCGGQAAIKLPKVGEVRLAGVAIDVRRTRRALAFTWRRRDEQYAVAAYPTTGTRGYSRAALLRVAAGLARS